MTWSNIYFIPLISFILLPLTFITSYIISVLKNDVYPAFPFISDTGTKSPESCLFSQFLNITSALILMTLYLRYKQIEQYYRDHLSIESSLILSRNYHSFIIGILSCLGLSIVANFQETSIFYVHLAGAFLCFGGGLIYCWIQTWMSFRTCPLVNSRFMAQIRFTITFIMTISFLILFSLGPYSQLLFKGNDIRKWHPEDGGYLFHVISTIAEWICALSLDIFISTFIREMQKISLSSPKILFVNENINSISSPYPYSSEDPIEVYIRNSPSSSSMRDSIAANLSNSLLSSMVGNPNNSSLIH